MSAATLVFAASRLPKLTAREMATLKDRVAAGQAGNPIEFECPCCGCAFFPDDFVNHLESPPEWCDRKQWGVWRDPSESADDDPLGRLDRIESQVVRVRQSATLLSRAAHRHAVNCHDASVGELMVDLAEHDAGIGDV